MSVISPVEYNEAYFLASYSPMVCKNEETLCTLSLVVLRYCIVSKCALSLIFFGTPRKGRRMNKLYPDAATALADIVKDGQTIAVGGFGLCGIPEALDRLHLRDSGKKES